MASNIARASSTHLNVLFDTIVLLQSSNHSIASGAFPKQYMKLLNIYCTSFIFQQCGYSLAVVSWCVLYNMVNEPSNKVWLKSLVTKNRTYFLGIVDVTKCTPLLKEIAFLRDRFIAHPPFDNAVSINVAARLIPLTMHLTKRKRLFQR